MKRTRQKCGSIRGTQGPAAALLSSPRALRTEDERWLRRTATAQEQDTGWIVSEGLNTGLCVPCWGSQGRD